MTDFFKIAVQRILITFCEKNVNGYINYIINMN